MTNLKPTDSEQLETVISNITGGWLLATLHAMDFYPTNGDIAGRTRKINQELKAAIEGKKTQWQQEVLCHIYELSPRQTFENWKPQDAMRFYERLKAYEVALTAALGPDNSKTKEN